jgi:hypothetical protein
MRRKVTPEGRVVTKTPLEKATIVALSLIPVVALVRAFYRAPYLHYGRGQMTANSVLLLLFGMYAFVICVLNLLHCRSLWRTGQDGWGRQLGWTYILVLVFAVSLPFLTMFDRGVWPQYLGQMLPIVSPAFFFAMGVAMLAVGLAGVTYRTAGPRWFLLVILATSVVLTLGGASRAWLVFCWWLGGGINPW